MSKSLYCIHDPNTIGTTFGIMPHEDKYWPDYGRMSHKVGLYDDKKWQEVKHLQNMICRADIWEDFPAKGYTLVASEIKAGDEEQRIDIIYIRDDGALLPCELKRGGNSRDSHGQLIRYIADLHFQTINLEWVRSKHKKFLKKIDNDAARDLHLEKFNNFLNDNQIRDRYIRILPRAGIIMDEDFKSQMLTAVRYLNEYCGFSIRLIQIEAYVDDDWNPDKEDYMFRIDFTDVQ